MQELRVWHEEVVLVQVMVPGVQHVRPHVDPLGGRV
jgi:hypothetical protein